MSAATHIKLRDARSGGKIVMRRMLIPDAATVAAAISAVLSGSRMALGALRKKMADESGADATCPVTMWKRLVVIAEAQTAPFWRVVDIDSANAPPLPGGLALISRRLAAEVGSGAK